MGLNKESKMYESYRFKSYDLEKAVISLKNFQGQMFMESYARNCLVETNVDVAEELINQVLKLFNTAKKISLKWNA